VISDENRFNALRGKDLRLTQKGFGRGTLKAAWGRNTEKSLQAYSPARQRSLCFLQRTLSFPVVAAPHSRVTAFRICCPRVAQNDL